VTLDCIAGLLEPDAGRIVVGERVLFDTAASIRVPPRARQLGYVFQGYALFPHLSVLDNVAFGLHALPRRERHGRARGVLARRGRPSSGERVRSDTAPRARVPPRARERGYVFHGYALFPHLSALDNVALGLHALSRRERDGRARAVLERIGLAGLERRHPAELS